MTVAAPVAADHWLTEQLGVPAYHLGEGDPVELPAGPSFVDAKVPTHDVGRVDRLESAGFRVVDTAVTLELPSRTVDAPITATGFAAPGDADVVAEIAATAITLSRFHLDPRIPDVTASALKAAWTRSFFAGNRGAWMVVARTGSTVVGFLQLIDTVDALVIDLVAVRPLDQGAGLGRSMMARAARDCGSASALRVGTQAANMGSLRFYESLGFRVVGTQYVLHRHGS